MNSKGAQHRHYKNKFQDDPKQYRYLQFISENKCPPVISLWRIVYTIQIPFDNSCSTARSCIGVPSRFLHHVFWAASKVWLWRYMKFPDMALVFVGLLTGSPDRLSRRTPGRSPFHPKQTLCGVTFQRAHPLPATPFHCPRSRSDRGPQHLSCPHIGLTVHWAVSVRRSTTGRWPSR